MSLDSLPLYIASYLAVQSSFPDFETSIGEWLLITCFLIIDEKALHELKKVNINKLRDALAETASLVIPHASVT